MTIGLPSIKMNFSGLENQLQISRDLGATMETTKRNTLNVFCPLFPFSFGGRQNVPSDSAETLAAPSIFHSFVLSTASVHRLIEVLCALLVVFAGCDQPGQNDNSEELKSTPQPPAIDAADIPDSEHITNIERGNTTETKRETDATLIPDSYDANGAAIRTDSSYDAEQLPIIDASVSQPKIDLPDIQCGALSRLQNSDGVINDAVVIRNGDGYMTLVQSSPDDISQYDLYNVDLVGNEIYQLNTDIPSFPGIKQTRIAKAETSGNLLAVLTTCIQKGGMCGYSLFVHPTDSSNTEEYEYDTLFKNILGSSYDSSYFTIAPEDTLVIGTLRGSSLESFSGQLGLARLDLTGKIISETYREIDSDYLISRIQLESDEYSRTIVLLESVELIPIINGPVLGGFDIRSHSRILVFDKSFNLLNDWQAPQDVLIYALSPIEQDRLLLVGGQMSDGQMQTWLSMYTLDESATLTESWTEARLDESGIALAIDSMPRGEFILTGVDTAGTPWLQRYNAIGAPLWDQRIEANPENGIVGSGPFPAWSQATTAAISLQSDDSILLAINELAFIYCE